jgi:hypothetical protein
MEIYKAKVRSSGHSFLLVLKLKFLFVCLFPNRGRGIWGTCVPLLFPSTIPMEISIIYQGTLLH